MGSAPDPLPRADREQIHSEPLIGSERSHDFWERIGADPRNFDSNSTSDESDVLKTQSDTSYSSFHSNFCLETFRFITLLG